MTGSDEIIKPTPERMQKAIGYDEVVETMPGGLTKKNGAVRLTGPLLDIFKKGRLTAEQYAAGERYFIDWYIGYGSTERVTMKWQEYIGGGYSPSGNMDAAERRVFHQNRYHKANAILEEMRLRKPVHWLVICGLKAEQVGRMHWRYNGKHSAGTAAVVGIGDALHRLAIFYGISR